MPLRRTSRWSVLGLSVAWILAAAAPIHAQVLGPAQRLTGLQAPINTRLPMPLPSANLQGIDNVLQRSLALTRTVQINALLRKEGRRVDMDPQGAPILRGEFLAMNLSGASLDAVLALGFSKAHEVSIDAVPELSFVVLRDTRNLRAEEAMRILRQAAPAATFTYQHLYLPAGNSEDPAQATSSISPPEEVRRLGLIDGGVDTTNPALVHAHVEQHGCGTPKPSRHGTAVAARLVDGEAGELFAADLWCGDTVGGATSQLVEALAWMASKHVPVINISLVGPDNPVLARAIQAMLARGHVLVSAAGNDGPAAPPLFPAAYPGVIGVGGVDARGRVLPESASGDQVAFCASGVIGSGRDTLRGTSFAAPIVAHKAAHWTEVPSPGAPARVLQHLIGEARALDPSGHDPRCGHGVLSP
ncbi:S8 family serine peptidase [Dyella jiangningensis]|uniref:Peptidase S8 n=1 Tax=Dyella jiangningensis TaxID=1379159 RepID=A0A328NXT5_9GAMM|nr:S8 family serine peptidase [Dyella jiangningensis]RAO75008.1 peptidase S8 [Dyella jiangningensis]